MKVLKAIFYHLLFVVAFSLGMTSCLSYQTTYHADGIYQLRRGDKVDVKTVTGDRSSGKVLRIKSDQILLRNDTFNVLDIHEIKKEGYAIYKKDLPPTGLLTIGDEVKVVRKNKVKTLGRLTYFDSEKVSVNDYVVTVDISLNDIKCIEKDISSPSRRKVHDIGDIALKVIIIIPVMLFAFVKA